MDKKSSTSQHYCQRHACVATVIEGRFGIPTLAPSVHCNPFALIDSLKHFKSAGWRERRRDTHLVHASLDMDKKEMFMLGEDRHIVAYAIHRHYVRVNKK